VKILHYSYDARENGNRGGVEKFGWYFQQATNCAMYYNKKPLPWSYNPNYLMVVDGGSASRTSYSQPLISVVHGTWKELHRRCNMTDGPEVRDQEIAWSNPEFKKVAVSKSVANQLKEHHNVDADAIILHGVDLNKFKPRKHQLPRKPVVIHAATDFIKHRGDMLKLDKELGGGYELKFLDAQIGEEPEKFAQGDIFLHWSNYEGNSYAMIEALAAGLPIVGTGVGAFETPEIRESAGFFIQWDLCNCERLKLMLESVCDSYSKYEPRAVAEEFFDYDRFKEEWHSFIRESFKEVLL